MKAPTLTGLARLFFAIVLSLPMLVLAEEPTPEQQIATLKQEIELLKLRVEQQEQEAKLAKASVSSDPDTAAALAQAEIAKALAEAEKSKAESDVAADLALYKGLAAVDLSKAGVAGSYLSKNDLPASLRSKVLAEEQFAKAVKRICLSPEFTLAVPAASQAFLVDNALVALERAAANKLLKERVTKTTEDLNKAIEQATGVKPAELADFGGVAAALQGLNLLSQATRLFRVDSNVQVDTVAIDANRTVLPIVALTCKVEVIRPDVLYLRGELPGVDTQLTSLRNLRVALEKARLVSAQIDAEIADLKKKTDPESANNLKTKNAAALNLGANIKHAEGVVADLGTVTARELAYSTYLEDKLSSTNTLRLVSVDSEAESRRVIRQNAWSSAKPFAVGAALVRVTVRDETGRTLFSSAAYDESGRIAIEKEKAVAAAIGPTVLAPPPVPGGTAK
jgi:hypothetical protein